MQNSTHKLQNYEYDVMCCAEWRKLQFSDSHSDRVVHISARKPVAARRCCSFQKRIQFLQ